jgi:hypothetical protein
MGKRASGAAARRIIIYHPRRMISASLGKNALEPLALNAPVKLL